MKLRIGDLVCQTSFIDPKKIDCLGIIVGKEKDYINHEQRFLICWFYQNQEVLQSYPKDFTQEFRIDFLSYEKAIFTNR